MSGVCRQDREVQTRGLYRRWPGLDVCCRVKHAGFRSYHRLAPELRQSLPEPVSAPRSNAFQEMRFESALGHSASIAGRRTTQDSLLMRPTTILQRRETTP